MFKLLIYCLLFVFMSVNVAAQTQELNKLYQQKKYNHIIQMFQDLPLAAHSEDSLYFLALSYVQTNKIDRAKEVLELLISYNPDYYVYRLNYDLDFAMVLEKTGLQQTLWQYRTGILLAKEPIKGHELVKTNKGLCLYHNGLRVPLTEDLNVSQAGFVNPDIVYYLNTDPKAPKADGVLHLYSGKEKKEVLSREIQGKLERIYTDAQNRILIQTTQGVFGIN